MQQSSAIPKNQGLGCGRLLRTLTPPRCAFLYLQVLARWHPYILLLLYTCFTNFLSRRSLDCSAQRWTLILLSEGQTLHKRHIAHENKAVSCKNHSPLIGAVERLY